MRDPYLLLGLRMGTASPEHLQIFQRMMIRLLTLLGDIPLTELKTPGVYTADLPRANSRAIWRDVSILLSNVDQQVGDDLQWFAHLSDRRGSELSYN